MRRVLVVLPFYGGSLPIGRYCAAALRDAGCLVDVFEAPDFHSAFTATQSLQVAPDRQEYLENSFLQVVSQATLAKVESFAPDLVLCMAQAPLNRQALKRLRKDGVATAMWFVEDFRLFTYWRAFAPFYDIFAVIQKEPFLTELAETGVANALYLPLAALPAVHKPLALNPVEKKRFGAEISFMGAGYPNRRAAFRNFTGRDFKIWGTEWDDDPILAPLVQMQGARISTEDTVRIFNATRVNLNLHSSVQATQLVTGGDFVNPRTFELAACGAFQLVDRRELLPELFAEDELATFGSLDDLREKMDYFLTREDERRAYAGRGQERVLRDHTYQNRMQTLLAFAAERIPGFSQNKKPAFDWPESMPQDLRDATEALLVSLQLPPQAGFDGLVTTLRAKSGELSSLETAILFLDEWKKQYTR